MKKFFILIFCSSLLAQQAKNFPNFEEYLLSKKTEKYNDKREEEKDKVNFYLVYLAELEAEDSKANINVEGNVKNIDVAGFIRYRYENSKRRNLAESFLIKRKEK